MPNSCDFHGYAAKMREQVVSGVDLAVDVRFVDMISDRGSRILDIGCGIGNAVGGLRARGHESYGIDPNPEVLDVAAEFYDDSWFRLISAADISAPKLADQKLPRSYDVVIMSGNVPAFLPDLSDAVKHIADILRSGGILVIGTTAHTRGGPRDQDAACVTADLRLEHRFGDWHLGEFDHDSPWSVSVFSRPGTRPKPDSPDGMFILP